MNRILVRMELGTVDGPMPDFNAPTEEFRRKAEALGIPVKPSLKVTDPLERPEAWDAPPGTEGWVAFLGTVTSREDAVEALSQVKVAAAVISVKSLSLAEAKEFEGHARRLSELRKKKEQQAAAEASNSGRHAARTPAQATSVPGGRAAMEASEPYELTLTTPDEARKTPLDISELGS